MGLLRVAAVAGTASAVSGRVRHNQEQKWAAQEAAQNAAPAAAPAASDEDPMAQVAKLAELHKQGILTDEEFAAAKAKALGI
jgi:membrane protease subunit (stomatin/prohibitin family)